MPWSSFLKVEFYASFFTLLFHLHQEALSFLFSFYLKGGVIFISEVIDISPSNLDSSLCFIQPAFCIRYFIYKLNKQGDNVQPWHTLFPFWNQSVACPVLTVASWPAYRFLKRQVRWSDIPISFRIFIMSNAGLDEAQLESRLRGEISITSYRQMTLPLWQKKQRKTKKPLDESERGEWKSCLKTQHSEN